MSKWPCSPRACIEGELFARFAWCLVLLSPRANTGSKARNNSKSLSPPHTPSYFPYISSFSLLLIFHLFLHISHIFLHTSFIFFHIRFIFSSYFFIFMGLGRGREFLEISSYFFILFSSYSWDFKKLRSLPLYIGPGTWKNSDLFSYIWALLGFRKNPSYLICGHETCFCCRDLNGNFFFTTMSAKI